jgi:hypothetical protein
MKYVYGLAVAALITAGATACTKKTGSGSRSSYHSQAEEYNRRDLEDNGPMRQHR